MDITPDISVVVPTYQRPDVLSRCLHALNRQSYQPMEILVCYRCNDASTKKVLESLEPSSRSLLKEIVLGANDNLECSMNAGLAASRGQIIALTDDDAEASQTWLEQLIGHFLDPTVAGVGGKDMQEFEKPKTSIVGKVQWFGRRIANHQTGFGPPRPVDVLKGVNCCFRADLIRQHGIDRRLRGRGNVAHWELALCLPLVRRGMKLIYDPSITVRHHVAPRKDGDTNQRGGFEPRSLIDFVHNETFPLLEHLSPTGKAAFLAWSLIVGTHFTPGFLAMVHSMLYQRHPAEAVHRFLATQLGRIAGVKTWLGSCRECGEATSFSASTSAIGPTSTAVAGNPDEAQ